MYAAKYLKNQEVLQKIYDQQCNPLDMILVTLLKSAYNSFKQFIGEI